MAGVGNLKRICKDAFSKAGAIQETCLSRRKGDFKGGLKGGLKGCLKGGLQGIVVVVLVLALR